MRCRRFQPQQVSTECLIVTVLLRGGVVVYFDTSLRTKLVPNANGNGRGRRLAFAATP